jgi:amino acid transporter
MLALAFMNGGPASLVWGSVLGGIGHLFIAMSLGEMASMDPTVGAQYRWSARFARKWPAFWGLMQGSSPRLQVLVLLVLTDAAGWITLFAWIVSVAASLMIMATTTQGLIGLWDETYTAKPWHATLLMWGFLVLAIVCNLFLRKMLNVFETVGGVCHVLFFVAVIIILTTLGRRTDASFVFTTINAGISGWKDPGVCFNLGVIVTAGPLCSYDSVLHMSKSLANGMDC